MKIGRRKGEGTSSHSYCRGTFWRTRARISQRAGELRSRLSAQRKGSSPFKTASVNVPHISASAREDKFKNREEQGAGGGGKNHPSSF